ncbi:Uncharacterized protein QJS10_CPB18g01337 [Acorus calamus]|uniref:Glutaredoxin domain-containing protein n=1 Tax=Acorus calamus TaxID=4465 RepID=A0AAV9CL79_ACOCL|nr:Uncharacterized protein QJS10_CPB18g01337 [Acorus calamus]
MIDTWELMEGLDVTPLYLPKTKADDRRSFSFDSSVQRTPAPPPPPWLHNVVKPNEDKFDPNVLSTFRKALEQLSPEHGFLLRRASPGPNKESGLVKSMVGVFEREKNRKRNPPSGCEVVLYYTSLRGVRRTYEECCEVRRILRGYGVRVDERDVSMDLGYKEEVRGRGLPAVVVRGEWVGGAEEVRGLHEMGEMEGVLKGVGEVVGGGGGSCEGCGDVRFVNCGRCYGSCKVFVGAEGGGGFERCTDCNENGIVRCPVCSC